MFLSTYMVFKSSEAISEPSLNSREEKLAERKEVVRKKVRKGRETKKRVVGPAGTSQSLTELLG